MRSTNKMIAPSAGKAEGASFLLWREEALPEGKIS